MMGSPENNFSSVQLGNALRNSPDTQDRQPLGDRSIQGYRQPSQTWQPSMLSPNQYGNPTPQMGNWQQPQSNASFNMQPQIPNMNQTPQGPMGLQQTQGQNRFGVGLARPMPQQTQVS